MSKKLVTAFSASGVTLALAQRLADAIGADFYEIRPAAPYTAADLDWTNKQSRSTIEMQDKSCRPALADTGAPVAQADVIFVGFPIWWYREPSIIDSFLESYSFIGKTIVPFATSGSSDIGREAPDRMAQISQARVLPGKRFSAHTSSDALKNWADGLGL